MSQISLKASSSSGKVAVVSERKHGPSVPGMRGLSTHRCMDDCSDALCSCTLQRQKEVEGGAANADERVREGILRVLHFWSSWQNHSGYVSKTIPYSELCARRKQIRPERSFKRATATFHCEDKRKTRRNCWRISPCRVLECLQTVSRNSWLRVTLLQHITLAEQKQLIRRARCVVNFIP